MKKVKTPTILSILLLLGILTMINVIGVRNFIRFDLTSSKMYSLSDASKNIVSSIPDKVIVKAYFSPNLPSPYNVSAQYLRDMLEDYRAYSKGHLDYSFIDPGSEEDLEKEAQSFRIPPQTFQVVANDKIEVKKGYMGVAFIYGDKQEVIPVVSDIANLEYEITSLLNRLTSSSLPKLGFASTGNETQQLSMQQLSEELQRNYNLVPVNIDAPIDSTLAGLFLLAPREPLTEWQLFNLDQFIMNDGKLAIFANSYDVSMNNGYANQRDLNLNGFLNHYGLGIEKNLIIDNNSASVPVPRQQGFIRYYQQVQVPFLATLTTLNKENTITRQLDQLQTYFASSIDTTLAVEKGYDVDVLMYTSELSGRQWGPTIQMNVLKQWTEQDFPESHIPVAAIVNGEFTSYFAESGPPQKPVQAAPAESGNEAAEPQFEEYNGPFKASADGENRLFLMGDGNIGTGDFVDPRGLLFMVNTADWLAQTEDLISIRSKVIAISPLKPVSNMTRKIVKWSNHIGPVVFAVLLGIILWQIRRHRKKAMMTLHS